MCRPWNSWLVQFSAGMASRTVGLVARKVSMAGRVSKPWHSPMTSGKWCVGAAWPTQRIIISSMPARRMWCAPWWSMPRPACSSSGGRLMWHRAAARTQALAHGKGMSSLAVAGRGCRMVGLKAIDRDMRMAHRDRMR
jgi:hypothetical protein